MSLVIVHADSYMRDDLRDFALDAGLPLEEPMRFFGDAAGARADIAARKPLVLVTAVDLADGARSTGVALAAEMQARWPGVPVCLVAKNPDPELTNAVLGLTALAVILEGGDLEREFRHALRRMLLPAPAAGQEKPREPRYDVNIRLLASGNCTYEVRSTNTEIPHSPHIPFGVDPQKLKSLMEDSVRLQEDEHWRASYQRIGSDLTRALIHEQAFVSRDLGIIEGLRARSPVTVGMCFTVERSLYPIAVESLSTPEPGEHRFWLQGAPLWRQLPDFRMDHLPLFADSETRGRPINCLLVDAECAGKVTLHGQDVKVNPLPGVKREIGEILREAMGADPACVGQIGHIRFEDGKVVTSIRRADGTQPPPERSRRPFDEVLGDLLSGSEPWHLVHFAGHSHFTTESGQEYGYVFLPTPAKDPGVIPAPMATGIPRFATWLQSSRFVYLSSCVSSHHDFAFNLCANNIPAMSGFRWQVDDELACLHSARFYRSLFRHRSIERALHETWVDMFAEHRDHRVWASSQFVIQGTA